MSFEDRVQAKMSELRAVSTEKEAKERLLKEEAKILKMANQRLLEEKEQAAKDSMIKSTLDFINTHYDVDEMPSHKGNPLINHNWMMISESPKPVRQAIFDWIRSNPHHSDADLYKTIRNEYRIYNENKTISGEKEKTQKMLKWIQDMSLFTLLEQIEIKHQMRYSGSLGIEPSQSIKEEYNALCEEFIKRQELPNNTDVIKIVKSLMIEERQKRFKPQQNPAACILMG
jgi:predicted protein tyrosine phosphatase